MKVELTYFQGGKTWKEIVHANNVQNAKKIGEARNPSIKIVAANPVA
tara:strand:- start:545 stop:685 length:141 start_codon:yes stop_codon:yes gene_type:complete